MYGTDAEEEQRAGKEIVEVSLAWGSSVIALVSLGEHQEFFVGETCGKDRACQLFVPGELLGTERHLLLSVDAIGVVRVHPPALARGWLRLPDEMQLDLASQSEFLLTSGTRAHIELGEFVLTVRAVGRAPRVARGLAIEELRGPLAYFASSFAVFGSLLGVLAFMVPPLGLTDDVDIDKDRLVTLKQYLDASAAREEERPEPTPVASASDAPGGPSGEAAAGATGSMGKPEPTPSQGRFAVQAKPDSDEVFLARMRAREEASHFGMIAVVSGDLSSPLSPWGQESSQGSDALSANGAMWADALGEATGNGGLGLSGIGEGGGRTGRWIGMSGINTIGPGAGGPGQWGNSLGRPGATHVTKTPKVGTAPPQTSGHLPAEVIQRTVRQNFGRFRMCYQTGLSKNPSLEGRVSVRFLIDSRGAVSNVGLAGPGLPDASVNDCLKLAFYGLSFTAPERGTVSVTYPLVFSPE